MGLSRMAYCNAVLEIRKGQQSLADTTAGLEREIANAAHLVGRQPVLDVAVLDRRMPARQPIEITDLRPDLVGRRVEHARCIHLHHLGPRLALLRGGIRLRLTDALPLGRVNQPLEVSGHLRQRAGRQADLLEQLVDQRALGTIPQRAVDDLVAEALLKAPIGAAATSATQQAVDLENLDLVDLLQRLDALAHDRFEVLDQVHRADAVLKTAIIEQPGSRNRR